MNTQKGMTLVELLVSLVIVLLIMGSATAAYLKLLRGYKIQGKVSQSYMANLTGLELLRYDIEMAGYGLPQAAAYASEAVNTSPAGLTNPDNPTALNDNANPAPRSLAFSGGGGRLGTGCSANSDILSIKSSLASINTTSRKWSMISWDGALARPFVKQWNDSNTDFIPGDRFIILDSAMGLQTAPAGDVNSWCHSFQDAYYGDASGIVPATFTNQQVFMMYGIDPAANPPIMPFNRVDYYLARPASGFPRSCDPNSYTLYRSTINNVTGATSGVRTPMPIMDCVMDFQVAFGLHTNDANTDDRIDTWVTDLSAATLQPASLVASSVCTNGDLACYIRKRVREVRVFILYHEGGGDVGREADFRFSGFLNLGDPTIAGDPNFRTFSNAAAAGSLSSFTPPATDAGYRWKVVELAIKPMNLK